MTIFAGFPAAGCSIPYYYCDSLQAAAPAAACSGAAAPAVLHQWVQAWACAAVLQALPASARVLLAWRRLYAAREYGDTAQPSGRSKHQGRPYTSDKPGVYLQPCDFFFSPPTGCQASQSAADSSG